jgi:hypothetical protein
VRLKTDRRSTVAHVAAYPAIQLFVERAVIVNISKQWYL